MRQPTHAHRILASAAFAATALLGAGARGDEVKEETRALPPFTEVEVSGALRLEVVVGGAQKIRVSAPEKALPLVKTEVKGARLQIFPDHTLRQTDPIVIHLELPSLAFIGASGAASVDATQLKGQRVTLRAGGASRIEAAGQVDHLEVDLEGASQLLAGKLRARQLTLRASGASQVEAQASDAVEVHLSGASTAKVHGKPKRVIRHESGASSLEID